MPSSSLTLNEAQVVLDAAVAECEKRGVNGAVAVVDDRGDLVLAARLDGVAGFVTDIAYGTAGASALWQAPSKGLAASANTNTVQQRANSLNGGRLVFAPGAVPLIRGGNIIGAVGVGGTGADVDDEIAAVAAAALPA